MGIIPWISDGDINKGGYTNQIRNRYEQVVEDAFSQKGLNKSATWSSVASTDIKGFENGHEGDNRVESKWRNLRSIISVGHD
jgi:hypothetical protein